MKYLFIFLNIISLINTFLLNECLTFENNEENSCWSHSYSSVIENRKHGSNCLKCQINNINEIKENTCRKTLQCLSLIFYNNSFFEQFFNKYRNTINDIFREQRERNTLIITLQNYNLTKISLEYLNSILKINTISYHRLHVIFIKPISDPLLIKVLDDFENISINLTYLSFSCNYQMDDQHWIEFKIKPKRKPEEIKFCPFTTLQTTTIKTMYKYLLFFYE